MSRHVKVRDISPFCIVFKCSRGASSMTLYMVDILISLEDKRNMKAVLSFQTLSCECMNALKNGLFWSVSSGHAGAMGIL